MAEKTSGPVKKGGNAGTSVVTCTCVSDYQDALYGRGRRLANKCNAGFRCTVCKAIR